jgi:hypothetical protein
MNHKSKNGKRLSQGQHRERCNRGNLFDNKWDGSFFRILTQRCFGQESYEQQAQSGEHRAKSCFEIMARNQPSTIRIPARLPRNPTRALKCIGTDIMTPHFRKLYVTLSGLPLSFELKWPFRRSTSGADFFVLHADIRVEASDALHAPVAVNLTQTVREVLPSLEAEATEGPVINALRKEADTRQLEFLKSPKLLPVAFSSRHYDFKRNKWDFGHAADDDLAMLLRRKVYWHERLGAGKCWLTDPVDLLYVESDAPRVLALADKMNHLLRIEGEFATATPALMQQADVIEAEMKRALDTLEKKHAFERG